MADPSHNIHGDLLPHVHLLSTHPFAVRQRVDLAEVAKWLINAPKIARDSAPFYWTYVDCPQDGSIFLIWQPRSRRADVFSSDGYMWLTPERSSQQPIGNGLIMEIYFQAAGFNPNPGAREQVAAHSRRRFRLILSPQPTGAAPPAIDQNLWIVHYGPSEETHRLSIPLQLPFELLQGMDHRRQILGMGQLNRKEFMLSDRVNWPQIHLPGQRQSMHTTNLGSRGGIPQTMAYPPQAGSAAGGPRRRGGGAQPGASAAPHPPGAMSAPHVESYDDEEDNSRGDMFDHMTPSEISRARYMQNHEWMEEIVSSPVRFGAIQPPDLNLGLRGALESLTKDIFEGQGAEALGEPPLKAHTGRLDPALADKFRERVEAHIAKERANLAEMTAQHEKIMAKFKANASIRNSERDLRRLVEGTGVESWRLEGRLPDDEDEDDGEDWFTEAMTSMDDLVAQLETRLGKLVTVVQDVCRVQDGGYQELQPEPQPVPEPPQAQSHQQLADASNNGNGGLQLGVQSASMSRQPSQSGSAHSGAAVGDADVEMGGTAAGLLDRTRAGLSSTPMPQSNNPTLQPPISDSATPSHHFGAGSPAVRPPPAITGASASGSTPGAGAGLAGDVSMHDPPAQGASFKDTATATPDQGTGIGEWVVVPPGGISPTGVPPAGGAGAETSAPQQQHPSNTTAAPVATAIGAIVSPPVGGGSSTGPIFPTTTTAAAPVASHVAASDPDAPIDFSSLGDLDTAHDALDSFDPSDISGPGIGGHGGGGAAAADDLAMDDIVEDSAFGDAFHGMAADADTME